MSIWLARYLGLTSNHFFKTGSHKFTEYSGYNTQVENNQNSDASLCLSTEYIQIA